MSLLSVVFLLTQFIIGKWGLTWHEFEGHCYGVTNAYYDHNDNFNNSLETCRKHGTYMVEIEKELEMTFLRTFLDFEYPRDQKYWVGLVYNNASQRYTWKRSGQEPLSSLWQTNEPNRSGRCVRLGLDSTVTPRSNATFKLADDNSSYRVVCKKAADMLGSVQHVTELTVDTNRCPMVSYPRSLLHCAYDCSRDKFCIGFQYSNNWRRCRPFRFNVTCERRLATPFTMWVREYARC